MMKILVIAEHDNKTLKLATHHTLSAAMQLGTDIDVLIVGADCQKVVERACCFENIKTILVADNEVYAHQLAENSAVLVAELGKQYNYILVGATTFGKNLLPRVAALLDIAVVSEVTKIVTPDTFERPIYAGNALATVTLKDSIKALTIRTTAFAAIKESSAAKASIQNLSQIIPNTQSRFESQVLTESKRPELTAARVIISGGRGLKSAENFHLLEDLADRLGAAVGASRAAVDAGFAPNDYQVGQTGKVVAPDLYIAVGISGAIQHLAGMKDSKVIVAIKYDSEAPIFQIADYGLVGDLFKILPELREELDKALS
jgi:electron transfer flavoprotein alpha subunit